MKSCKIMSSTPSQALENYNSILDPTLSSYFSNPKKVSHLKHLGLIDRRGFLRSEPEIDEYNSRIQQKKNSNDLISRAIVMKAAELDRQRHHEMKKLALIDEKKQLVAKANSRKSRLTYTKKLDASFMPHNPLDYADSHFDHGEDVGSDEEINEVEDQNQNLIADESNDLNETIKSKQSQKMNNSGLNNSTRYNGPINTNICLPRMVPQPQYDKVLNLSNLLKTKVISPYLSEITQKSPIPNSEPPSLQHMIQKRIQIKYGQTQIRRKKSSPTLMKNSKATLYGQYNKPQSLKSINRLARSNLPDAHEVERIRQEKLEKRRQAREEYVKEQEQKERDEYWLEREIESEIRKMNCLSKADLTELKSLTNPPAIVKMIMEAVVLILDPSIKKSELTWKNVKGYLADPAFLTKCKIYNKDATSKYTMKKLKKYYISQDGFDVASSKKISSAGAGLCQWVTAIYNYKELVEKKEQLGRPKSVASGAASGADGRSTRASSRAAGTASQHSHRSQLLENNLNLVEEGQGEANSFSQSSNRSRSKSADKSKNPSRATTRASNSELAPSPQGAKNRDSSRASTSRSSSSSSLETVSDGGSGSDVQVKVRPPSGKSKSSSKSKSSMFAEPN